MFERDYDAEERERRQQVYADNLAMIQQHNAEADAGAHNFRLGVNQFSDMTSAEWAAYALSPTPFPVKPESERNVVELPVPAPDATIDWREKGAVTPVKNQGGCVSAPLVARPSSHAPPLQPGIARPRARALTLGAIASAGLVLGILYHRLHGGRVLPRNRRAALALGAAAR